MVRHAVPQLPIGQDNALVSGQFHGRGLLQKRVGADRMDQTPGISRRSLLPLGEQDGQVGEIIIQDEPGRRAVPPSQSMTEAAVHAPEPVRLLPGKGSQRRSDIAEHRIRKAGR